MDNKKHVSNYDIQADMARELFLKYDLELLVQKYHLQADPDWIYLTYFNAPFRISRKDGRCQEQIQNLWEECRSFNTVMTIYDLLCYSGGTTMPLLANYWCSVGSFIVTGIQDAGTFSKKYTTLFQSHFPQLKNVCEGLGGTPEVSKAGADICYRIPVTPFFPVLLQFWLEDEEFPPQIKVMWDQNTTRFLHFETTFYLQGDLLERICKQLLCV